MIINSPEPPMGSGMGVSVGVEVGIITVVAVGAAIVDVGTAVFWAVAQLARRLVMTKK